MEEEDWRVQERRDEKKEGSRQGCRGAGVQESVDSGKKRIN